MSIRIENSSLETHPTVRTLVVSDSPQEELKVINAIRGHEKHFGDDPSEDKSVPENERKTAHYTDLSIEDLRALLSKNGLAIS